ncbi:MAG TPA: AAA family ATPase [Methylomirabilota bacterium]|nr:AAA family ATPase [Methylomirabilota bacterium]
MSATFTSARFVGREDAFAKLATVLQSATAGDAGTLLLEGTAGVGSTRFIDEVINRVDALQEPMTVLRGCAFGPATDSPYAPLIRAMRPALAALPDDQLVAILGSATEELRRLFPELGERLADRPGAGGVPLTTVPERRQARMLEGILGVLGRLGERRPVLLVIEDLHRADAGTRTLVTFLARIARLQRLAIVATYQADAIRRDDPWAIDLRSLERAPRQPDRLTLGPMGRDDLARLIEAIEGERPSASVLVVVVERSSGRPLVAEELLAARRELPTVSLTATFEDLVLARMAVRSTETRRVLRLLAPAGRPLTRAAVAAVAEAFEIDATSGPPRSSSAPRHGDGVLDADLSAGLDEALAHGFALENEDGVFLRHELVGRAVEADLLPSARIRHHAALAAALADQPFLAMHHHGVALDSQAAGRAAVAAADLAGAVDSPADELAALELAISAQGTAPAARRSGPSRGGAPARAAATPVFRPTDLAVRAAEAAFAADRPVRAAAYLDATIGAADARQDRTRLGLIYDRLGQFLRVAGDADGAVAARRRAVELVPTSPSIARAAVVAGLAQLRMLEGTFSVAEKLARDAIRVANACGPSAAVWELHATTTLGVSLGWRADPDAAVAMLTDARRMAEALGDLDELFRVYANLTTVLDLAGRHEEAVAIAFEGIAAARSAGLEAVYGNFLRGNAADSLFLLGRWEEARSLSMTALEWLPAGVNFLNTLVSLATVEIELSAGEAAGRLLGQTLLELEAVRDAQQAVPLHLASASFALWRGDLADARRAAERGWTLVRETEDWILAARTAATAVEVEAASAAEAREQRDLASLAGARERARDVIKSAEAVVRRHGVDPSLGSRRLADAWLATARAYRRRVDGRDDPASWRDVGDAWAALKIPYETARARWREAEARLGSGAGRAGRADARAPLLEAVEIALRLGAMPLLRELSELARRALITLPAAVDARSATSPEDRPRERVGVGPGVFAAGPANGSEPSALMLGVAGVPEAPTKRDTFGLSGREREVLMQIARGRTNREIGERLFISQKTVGVHVGNILAKLGASGRVEAAMVAIRLELVPTPAARRPALALG